MASWDLINGCMSLLVHACVLLAVAVYSNRDKPRRNANVTLLVNLQICQATARNARSRFY